VCNCIKEKDVHLVQLRRYMCTVYMYMYMTHGAYIHITSGIYTCKMCVQYTVVTSNTNSTRNVHTYICVYQQQPIRRKKTQGGNQQQRPRRR
jgi:hypothetical protein